MRIAVVDSEGTDRGELISHIRQHLPQAEITEADSGTRILALLEWEQFDILFLDTHLGDMEGITAASLARRLTPEVKIVFATAHPEYAVRAFEVQADDYILKPFVSARVAQALDRCVRSAQTGRSQDLVPNRLAIRSNRRTVILDTDDINYVETDGAGRGCVLHTLKGDSYPDNTTLAEYENRLDGLDFYRIHKTCLVRLRYIQEIFPWNSSLALRVRGSEVILPISRDRVRELRRQLNIQ